MLTKIKYPLLFATALSLLIISGCAVGPNYERPDYSVGKEYRFQSNADTISFADTSWTYLFKDPVLQDMIRRGLQYNFDLKIAFERVNQAMAMFKQARADLYPSLSVSGTAQYANQQIPISGGGTSEYHDYYATANLTWELDIWGKLRRAKQSARADLLAQQSYQQAVRINLIAGIATAYFNLIEFEDELQITRYTVELRKKSLELVRNKLIAGTASGLAVAQAEAELADAMTKVPSLEKVVAIQENALHLLLGELPGPVSMGDSISNQINTEIIPKEGIPSQLIVRRPDIMAVEQQLVSANAQVGVARGMMLPTLAISANIGYSDLGAGIIGSAVGNLVAPIFNMGKLKANLRRAQAVKAEMLVTYQQSIYTGLKEVSDGIISVDKQKQVVEESVKLTAAAQMAYDLSYQLYNAGYASYLDVMDAQRLLYSAQINQSVEYNNHLLSIVNLYLALGGGWK